MPSRQSVLAVAARLGAADSHAGPAMRRARQLLELDALADELELPGAAKPRRPVEPEHACGGARLAERLRDELGLGAAGVGDLIGLCERDCGLDVAVEGFGDGPSGLLVQHAHDVALALLNADDTAARQRFTLAHELGHHVFADPNEVIVEGDGVGAGIGDGIGVDLQMERRANEFAIEFLLPGAGVRRTVGGGPVTVGVVVDGMVRFGVSREAFLNRLRTLRLVTASERDGFMGSGVRSLFAAAGRAGDYGAWATGVGQRRAPARIERRLLDAYRSGRIGIGPLAQLVGRDADDLRDELADAGMAPTFADNDFALADI